MGEMLNEIGDAVGKAVEDPATLPVKIAANAFRKLEGKPFLSSTRHDIVDAGWNVVAAPGRVFWSLIKGMSKGTLRLAWSAIKLLPLPLPMLDSWKAERAKQGASLHASLNNLREQLSPGTQKFTLPSETEYKRAA
ncbi:MAG: hypothetical protein V1876_03720 [Candidatus Peregrinibacteria bacterium]